MLLAPRSKRINTKSRRVSCGETCRVEGQRGVTGHLKQSHRLDSVITSSRATPRTDRTRAQQRRSLALSKGAVTASSACVISGLQGSHTSAAEARRVRSSNALQSTSHLRLSVPAVSIDRSQADPERTVSASGNREHRLRLRAGEAPPATQAPEYPTRPRSGGSVCKGAAVRTDGIPTTMVCTCAQAPVRSGRTRRLHES